MYARTTGIINDTYIIVGRVKWLEEELLNGKRALQVTGRGIKGGTVEACHKEQGKYRKHCSCSGKPYARDALTDESYSYSIKNTSHSQKKILQDTRGIPMKLWRYLYFSRVMIPAESAAKPEERSSEITKKRKNTRKGICSEHFLKEPAAALHRLCCLVIYSSPFIRERKSTAKPSERFLMLSNDSRPYQLVFPLNLVHTVQTEPRSCKKCCHCNSDEKRTKHAIYEAGNISNVVWPNTLSGFDLNS